jgi:hypothetical protein
MNFYQPPVSSASSPANQMKSSFNRMMSVGKIGDLGGRMGELEKASIRLGDVETQRSMAEKESQSKASERLALESEKRSLQSKTMRSLEEQDRLNQITRQIAMLGT